MNICTVVFQTLSACYVMLHTAVEIRDQITVTQESVQMGFDIHEKETLQSLWKACSTVTLKVKKLFLMLRRNLLCSS